MPQLPHWVWAALLSATCALALWKGGRSERFGAMMFYGAWLATLLAHSPDRFATEWAIFAVDVALLAMLMGLALWSDRYWPIFITGFHLLDVLTHIGRMLDSSLPLWAYRTAAHIWGYLMIISLAVGTINRWRESLQPASMAPVSPPAVPLGKRARL